MKPKCYGTKEYNENNKICRRCESKLKCGLFKDERLLREETKEGKS